VEESSGKARLQPMNLPAEMESQRSTSSSRHSRICSMYVKRIFFLLLSNRSQFGYDLSVFLATVGVAEDGDVVTEKLSIGGDATSQTSSLGPIQGPIVAPEGGLNTHNTFESDTSLTRNDFFLANGDNHSFNGTLFSMMSSVGNPTGMYDVTGMGNYRAQRWDQSQAENPNFFFGPKGLLLYAAASFLYEVYPSANGSTAQATVESFFGAVPTPGSPGGYASVGERVPPNWFSRKAPYGLSEISEQAVEMYSACFAFLFHYCRFFARSWRSALHGILP
jgi:hypothetical protein